MNELQKKYVGDAHFRTEQMMKEIDREIYKKNRDDVIFPVRENEIIAVGVLADTNHDNLELEIEWRQLSPYKSLETSVVDFVNRDGVLSALDYIRQCAEDSEYDKIAH